MPFLTQSRVPMNWPRRNTLKTIHAFNSIRIASNRWCLLCWHICTGPWANISRVHTWISLSSGAEKGITCLRSFCNETFRSWLLDTNPSIFTSGIFCSCKNRGRTCELSSSKNTFKPWKAAYTIRNTLCIWMEIHLAITAGICNASRAILIVIIIRWVSACSLSVTIVKCSTTTSVATWTGFARFLCYLEIILRSWTLNLSIRTSHCKMLNLCYVLLRCRGATSAVIPIVAIFGIVLSCAIFSWITVYAITW